MKAENVLLLAVEWLFSEKFKGKWPNSFCFLCSSLLPSFRISSNMVENKIVKRFIHFTTLNQECSFIIHPSTTRKRTTYFSINVIILEQISSRSFAVAMCLFAFSFHRHQSNDKEKQSPPLPPVHCHHKTTELRRKFPAFNFRRRKNSNTVNLNHQFNWTYL